MEEEGVVWAIEFEKIAVDKTKVAIIRKEIIILM